MNAEEIGAEIIEFEIASVTPNPLMDFETEDAPDELDISDIDNNYVREAEKIPDVETVEDAVFGLFGLVNYSMSSDEEDGTEIDTEQNTKMNHQKKMLRL